MADSEKPKLRWYQFSLRTLLLFVTAVAIFMSWFAVKMDQARRQKQIIEELGDKPISLCYDYEIDGSGEEIEGAELNMPNWLIDKLGIDFFSNVASAKQNDVGFPEEGLSTLAELPHLKCLSLGWVHSDLGLESISRMKNLELLGIVVVKPYAALQYFQKLPKLKYLHLGFGDAASEELAPLQFLNHLEHLELFVHDGTPENSETLDGMLKFLTNMPRLQYLYVRGENFSGKGLIHLEKLPELQVLEIYCHDKILDDELDHLANLPKLKSLTIADSKLTDRSLERLKGLTRLEGLELHSELLTSEGIAELSKSLPKTNINDGSKYCGFGEEAY